MTLHNLKIAQQRFKPELKENMSFSDQLNNWLIAWIESKEKEGIKFIFTDTDDFDETDIKGTFERHKKRFQDTKEIHIWTGASENSIYGNSLINAYARGWHDYTHIVNDLGYDALSEIEVCVLQMAELPQNWEYERLLINAEITGQVLYFNKYGQFPENQRQFTLDYLLTGKI